MFFLIHVKQFTNDFFLFSSLNELQDKRSQASKVLGGMSVGGYSGDNLSQSQSSFARGELLGDRRKRLAEEFWGRDRGARSDDQNWRRRRFGDERSREMGWELERGRDGESDYGRDNELERARGEYERGRAVGREYNHDPEVEGERGRKGGREYNRDDEVEGELRGRNGGREYNNNDEVEGELRGRNGGRAYNRDIRREIEGEHGRVDDRASGVSSREGDGSVERDANNRPIPEFVVRARNEE